MPSTYTNLGVQLMATGEKAGTWGTLTNTNWNIMEQISGGYATQALTSGGTVTLTKTDGATGAVLANRVWKLTGALSDNAIVTVPDSIENWWLIDNASTNAYTVQVKTVSGTGVTWATTDKGTKLLYSDGTNVVDSTLGVSTDPGGSDTQVQYNNSGAFGGDANLVWSASTGLNIGSQKELRLQDTTGGEYIGMKAAGTTTSYTLTMPGAVATSNDQILTSTTGGVLSWVDNSGGTSWQAVITAATKTAVAGEGYFIDTTSNACTVTLPAGTLGDEVTCVDYAGTFDTNNLTVTPNGSEKIQGTAASLTVSVERAGLTLAYSGSSQGWLLKDK
jgi:hypothetical protein